MTKVVLSVLILAVLAVMAPQAVALPIVSLSSPDDLTQLEVGDTVRFDVTLSGLPTDDFIFVLNTRELFPNSLFAPVPDLTNSSGLTPGPILSLSSQQANFDALSFLGLAGATGNFSDSSPNPSAAISTNGLYYSFTLLATAAGSGVIQFDPAGTTYAANDTGFNLAPLPFNSPLAFAIGAVVPEPSVVVMTASGALMGIGSWWCRRSRPAA
jgi:hypothetical protein